MEPLYSCWMGSLSTKTVTTLIQEKVVPLGGAAPRCGKSARRLLWFVTMTMSSPRLVGPTPSTVDVNMLCLPMGVTLGFDSETFDELRKMTTERKITTSECRLHKNCMRIFFIEI